MSKANHQYNLFTLSPELFMEWHPTKNGKLTPKSVPLDRKKVWWLCENGHEWQATVRRRIKGAGCFVCEEEILIKGRQSKIFEKDKYQRASIVDYRKNIRHKYQGTVLLEDPSGGQWLYAQMKNYSIGGMYFEIEIPLKPGKTVSIRLDNTPFKSRSKTFKSIIKWCKKIENSPYSNYGVGIAFI